MADTYLLFRLSLIERQEQTFFTDIRTDRSQYLRSVFGRNISFLHYKKQFHYRPASLGSPYILGRVGREIQTTENSPPEDGFDEQLHESWLASVVALQPDDTGDGQKIAVQNQKQVGTPFAILRSMLAHINQENIDAQWIIQAQPIFDAATFWKFVEDHKGNVVSLTFDLIVPNGLWSATSTFREELKQANAATNAQQLTTTLKSDSGLKTDSQAVAEVVEYAEKGSGAISARSRDGHRYNSKNKIRSVSLFEGLGSAAKTHLSRAAENIARILKDE